MKFHKPLVIKAFYKALEIFPILIFSINVPVAKGFTQNYWKYL